MIGHVPRVVAMLVTGSFVGALIARADEPAWIGPHSAPPQTDVRAGGVLDHSFHYHRQPPAVHEPVAPPAGNWYGYGFPVETYRWGWFGAGRYYPTVIWHRGYTGHTVRWAYRKGY
jgi:hypothetical protein